MNTIGERLRCERLRSGVELDRIARQTKIPARLLSAIEQDQFDKLPGRVFTVSFVRQYAQALGMDETAILAEWRAQQEPPPPPPPASPVIVPNPKRQPGSAATVPLIAVTAMSAVLISIVFLGLPNQPSTRTGEPVSAQAAENSADRSAIPELPEPPAAAAPAESATSGLELVLTAQTPTWVRAKVDGQNVFAATLRPNESKILQTATAVNLVIGNAGGVQISLNGKPIGPIGPSGQVRDVEVTSSGSVQIREHKPILQDIY